jgi:hypothetical protein
MREKLAKKNFVKSIPDSELRFNVLYHRRPKTLNDALKDAVQFESLKEAERLTMSSTLKKVQCIDVPDQTEMEIHQLTKKISEELRELSDQVAQLENASGHTGTNRRPHVNYICAQSPTWPVKCYACRETGHIAKYCSKRRRSARRQTENRSS